MGAIDLRVLLRQWSGSEVAAKLTPAWRGGYYMTFSHKKSAKDAPVSLALVLSFASEAAADQFADVYRSSLAQRYKSVQAVPSPGQSSAFQWTTDEGTVRLFIDGSTVIAAESFTAEEAAKIHAALVPTTEVPVAQ